MAEDEESNKACRCSKWSGHNFLVVSRIGVSWSQGILEIQQKYIKSMQQSNINNVTFIPESQSLLKIVFTLLK